MSKKLKINSAEDAVTIESATIGDIFTTAVSTTEVLTGVYGLGQRVGLVVGGMAVNSFRLRGSFNPFVKA